MKKVKVSLKQLTKNFGSFCAVDKLNLDVEEGQIISLLGPSGCGKTTTLRLIAGLEEPDGGRIIVDGKVISDAQSVIPPEKRNMGMVFQSYAVWPHMTVFENVSYGLKLKGYSKDKIKEQVERRIRMVGLEGQEEKYPNQLSGGQQQRVALARALVVEPKILLLDEPLSNLDAKLRESMRFEIRELQQKLGITTIYVTHNQKEALVLSDMIAVMNKGNLVEFNDPDTLYEEPRTKFVANFIGLANFLEGIIIENKQGYLTVKTQAGQIKCEKAGNQVVDEKITLMIRPEKIRITSKPGSDNENSFQGVIEEAYNSGSLVDYFIRTEVGDITFRVQSPSPRRFDNGDHIYININRESIKIVE